MLNFEHPIYYVKSVIIQASTISSLAFNSLFFSQTTTHFPFQMKAPSIRQFYSMPENGLFVAPSADGRVTLGGTRDFGNFEQAVNPFTTKAILAYTAAVLPEIADSEFDSEWVSLWPYRGHVRVELDDGSRPSGPKVRMTTAFFFVGNVV